MASQAPEIVSDRLVGQLEATRAGMRRYRWWQGSVWAALAVVALAGVGIAADWAWELGTSARAAGLAVMAVVGLAVLEFVALRPRRLRDREEAAAEVEANFPKLGQRVRTTLEYVEPTPETAPATPGLVKALRVDTDRQTRDLDFQTVIPWHHLRGPLAALALLAVAGVVGLIEQPELRIAARRLFLVPDQYTRLTVQPGNTTLKAGESFTLQATIAGRPVSEARWMHRRSGSPGPWSDVSLAPGGDEAEAPRKLLGVLSSTLKDCRNDLEYRVVAGTIESPTYSLRVLQPLLLKTMEAKVEPPAYTRKPPKTETAGDFQVIEGSQVAFRFTLDHEPLAANLMVSPKAGGAAPKRIPLHVAGMSVTGALPRVDRSTEYRLVAHGCYDIDLDTKTWTIRVRPDEKPTIKFVKPPEEYAVIATAEIPMKVEAADDFGLTEVGIVYRVGKGPKETLLLDKYQDQRVTAQVLATLYLEKHQVDFTDGLTYYAYALDNHPPEPHRATTELRFIDILPFQQEFQLIEGGGTCNCNSATLEELILRQRLNLNRTFSLADEPKVDGEISRRLARAEREIDSVTAEFTQALEDQFGPVPSLREARDAMKLAATSLDGNDAKSATTEEETALSALIKARMNLRKLLKNQQSASACRKIDRQQLQKVRKPPPKKDDKQLAQLPQQIKKLAQEERSVCQSLGARAGAKPGEKTQAERQDAAAQTAQALQKAVRDDPALSDLARERMDAASETVQKAAASLKSGESEKAAERAGSAADQLDRLAEQVAGLKAKELAQKLAQARDLAQKLAKEEKGLSQKPGPGAAGTQKGLAEEAGTLADWFKRLPTDASDESRELSRALRQAAEANPPQELAEGIKQAAEALKAGQSDQAALGAAEAARRLGALAQDLDAARRAFVQPQLDQLLAAEKQAAGTQKALKSARDADGKAQAEKAMTDLLQAMEKLQTKDGALGPPTRTLQEAMRNHGGWSEARPDAGNQDDRPYLAPPTQYTEGVTRVLTALQSQIQEMILKNVVMDRDEGVPPQYKTLVEDYYRTLSEDLR